MEAEEEEAGCGDVWLLSWVGQPGRPCTWRRQPAMAGDRNSKEGESKGGR